MKFLSEDKVLSTSVFSVDVTGGSYLLHQAERFSVSSKCLRAPIPTVSLELVSPLRRLGSPPLPITLGCLVQEQALRK